MLGAACSSGTGASTLAPSELRARSSAICARVAEATGAIPAPTSTEELAAGFAAAHEEAAPRSNRLNRLRPPSALRDRFAGLVEAIDEVIFQFRLLEGVGGQEPRETERQLEAARQKLDDVDTRAARVDLPDCTSGSWGRGYVDAASAYIVTQLPTPSPPTGDFVADATAACGRFYERFAGIPAGTPAPSDPVEYAAFLQTLEDAYAQLLTDLRALTPPPGSETDFGEVIELIALAAKSVDRAERDPRELPDLERPLGAIGSELAPLVRILGFSC